MFGLKEEHRLGAVEEKCLLIFVLTLMEPQMNIYERLKGRKLLTYSTTASLSFKASGL